MDYQENQLILKEYQELYSNSLEKLKTEVQTIFPNAKISASVYSGIGSPILGVSFYLINQEKDQSYGIVDNDPVVTKFIGFLPEVHPTKETKFKLKLILGGLIVEPPKDSYLAMERVRLPYRKSIGNIDKQVDKLINYFKGVAQTIIDNKDNLYKKDIKDKYLTINL